MEKMVIVAMITGGIEKMMRMRMLMRLMRLLILMLPRGGGGWSRPSTITKQAFLSLSQLIPLSASSSANYSSAFSSLHTGASLQG